MKREQQVRNDIMGMYETLQEILNNRSELTDNVFIDNDKVPLGAIIKLPARDYAESVLEIVQMIIDAKKEIGIDPQKDLALYCKLKDGFGF